LFLKNAVDYYSGVNDKYISVTYINLPITRIGYLEHNSTGLSAAGDFMVIKCGGGRLQGMVPLHCIFAKQRLWGLLGFFPLYFIRSEKKSV